MYIDLEKAKQKFLNYTNSFDTSLRPINGKIHHSLRVMELSKQIATMMNLSQEDIELATLIGLLHDLGRFEQYTQYHTFKDNNIFDHADYAYNMLNSVIRTYIDSPKYDDIIKIAIKNHNKYSIEEGLTERQLLFSKLIRDADKLDILYEATFYFYEDQEQDINNSQIHPDALDSIKNHTLIKNEVRDLSSTINSVLGVIAMAFDLNFKESFQILKENDYINKTLDRFSIKDEENYKKIRHIVNDFIDSKLNS